MRFKGSTCNTKAIQRTSRWDYLTPEKFRDPIQLKNFSLNFGLKFLFDSVTCVNYVLIL